MSLNMPNVIESQSVAGDKTFSVAFKIINPEVWDKCWDLQQTFNSQLPLFFKQVVFASHKYLIRVTPLDSGRLRGGWTGILNKYNINYYPEFVDVSLVYGHSRPLSEEAIREGMALCSFEDTDLSVTLINSVPYAEYVEYGTSKMEGQNFTRRAMYKTELIMAEAFKNWLSDAPLDLPVSPTMIPEVVS